MSKRFFIRRDDAREIAALLFRQEGEHNPTRQEITVRAREVRRARETNKLNEEYRRFNGGSGPSIETI